MRIFYFFLLNIFYVFHASAVDLPRPWPDYSNPRIMDPNFKKQFSVLPLKGQVKDTKKYWSSDYWPLYKGNINYRWNSTNPVGFNLNSPSYEQAKKMSLKEMELLAPSEKFDLFTGQYSYPLRNHVQKRVSPRDAEWEGICHGWAVANLNHNEPTPKVVSNPDGIKIPFGSSDLKALLSYYYAYIYSYPNSTDQMGRRCNGRQHCTIDLNAGAFHIVLTNKVGIEGRGFIADIENGREVWNQVVYSYSSKIIAKDLKPTSSSARGTHSLVRIKTDIKVVFNIVRNSWTPVLGTNLQTFQDESYEYDLDLDVKGTIIGGEWHSANRPDFLWHVGPTKNFSGIFTRLPELLND